MPETHPALVEGAKMGGRPAPPPRPSPEEIEEWHEQYEAEHPVQQPRPRQPWEDSTRRQRLPANWPKLRASILKRDKHQCQHLRTDTEKRCLAPATHVDHRDPNGGDGRDNLRAMCEWHHLKKSRGEGARARAAKLRREPDYREQHPALAGTSEQVPRGYYGTDKPSPWMQRPGSR